MTVIQATALPRAPRLPGRRPLSRAEYTAGLRALADVLDDTPALAMPHSGSTEMSGVVVILNPEQTAELQMWIDALTDPRDAAEDTSKFREVCGSVGGLRVTVLVRKAVA